MSSKTAWMTCLKKRIRCLVREGYAGEKGRRGLSLLILQKRSRLFWTLPEAAHSPPQVSQQNSWENPWCHGSVALPEG